MAFVVKLPCLLLSSSFVHPCSSKKKTTNARKYILSSCLVASLEDPNKHHFLHVNDLTSAQLFHLLQTALEMKQQWKQNGKYQEKWLDGKTLAMIFAKPSARTRISFETGMYLLGGHALCLGEEVGIGKREAVKDVARVVASMNDAMMARLYAHSDLLELARFSKVPVINGLTDYNHPCQIVADALTILEEKKRLHGIKVVYMGDGNNIVHSWLELTSLVQDLEFVCCCPPVRMEKHGDNVHLDMVVPRVMSPIRRSLIGPIVVVEAKRVYNTILGKQW